MSDPNFQVRDAVAEAYTNLRLAAQRQGMAVPETEVVKCASCGRVMILPKLTEMVSLFWKDIEAAAKKHGISCRAEKK